MSENSEQSQNKLSTSGKKGKRKVEYCDLESHDEIICDYEENGASVVSGEVIWKLDEKCFQAFKESKYILFFIYLFH
jgi:hypothetical protein